MPPLQPAAPHWGPHAAQMQDCMGQLAQAMALPLPAVELQLPVVTMWHSGSGQGTHSQTALGV